MPELPEVESVRRQLAPELIGRSVVGVWRDPTPSPRISDVDRVVGTTVVDVTRRGKFLLCSLSEAARRDGIVAELVLHLGMTGSLRFDPTGGPEPAPSHDRVVLELDDGRGLRFRDPRRFGRVSVVAPGGYEAIPTLASLGPEPLSPAFDPGAFAAALATTTAPVKARLLDQRLVAGIGNIYADEALWHAQIHPASRRVGRGRALLLHAAIIDVLTAAIEREGTTFRDYRMVNGQSGRNATYLAAYGQAGQPCRRCGSSMRRTVVAQRGTTYCPTCQRH